MSTSADPHAGPAHLRGPHLRLPDERPRLRAAVRPARGRGLRAGRARTRTVSSAPDVVVFNTCAVRENADNRLYGNLGHLAPVKASRPGMQIAVGGCLAQKDRGEIVRRRPLGRRRVRHPQHRVAAGPARPCPAQRGGAGRDPRGARDVPLDAARRGATARTRAGSRSASGATTRARSASCRACAGSRRTGGPATCWPRSRRSSLTGCSRSPCSGRTSTPTAWSSATGVPSPSCCARAATSTGSSGSGSPARTRATSPTT